MRILRARALPLPGDDPDGLRRLVAPDGNGSDEAPGL